MGSHQMSNTRPIAKKSFKNKYELTKGVPLVRCNKYKHKKTSCHYQEHIKKRTQTDTPMNWNVKTNPHSISDKKQNKSDIMQRKSIKPIQKAVNCKLIRHILLKKINLILSWKTETLKEKKKAIACRKVLGNATDHIKKQQHTTTPHLKRKHNHKKNKYIEQAYINIYSHTDTRACLYIRMNRERYLREKGFSGEREMWVRRCRKQFSFQSLFLLFSQHRSLFTFFFSCFFPWIFKPTLR